MSFKHTARYVVVLKSGHPAAGGYHTSFTLALKHRRRLGKGARIIDRYETAPAAPKRRRAPTKKHKTRRTRKARCVCPPRGKRGKRSKSRRNPYSRAAPGSTDVFNLSTQKTRTYILPARAAVIAAYAQEHGDNNTWDYEKKYGRDVRAIRSAKRGYVTYNLGDWAAIGPAPHQTT